MPTRPAGHRVGIAQVPEPVGAAAPADRYVPVDDEELGVTRRQFFNRSILAGLGSRLGALGAPTLGVPLAGRVGGFGAKIVVGSEADAKQRSTRSMPFYNAAAKTYILPYPKDDIAKAKRSLRTRRRSSPAWRRGTSRCTRSACTSAAACRGARVAVVRVPVPRLEVQPGRREEGWPAPRGLDRFVLEVSGGNITVDTGNAHVLGPPIGTDTTGQTPEGAPCV